MNPALLSSKNQGFRTPPEVLDVVRQIGPIGLDPATTEDNPVGARVFYTPGRDGLTKTWADVLCSHEIWFCNPPFGRELTNWTKAFRFAGHVDGASGVSLTPARQDTKWWRDIVTADLLGFWKGRITFWSLDHRDGQWKPGAWNEKKGEWSTAAAPFPCVLSYWGRDVERVAKILRPHCNWIVSKEQGW